MSADQTLGVASSARGRLIAALAIGAAAALIVNTWQDWRTAAIGAWDAASLYLLVVSWLVIATEDASETEQRAAAYDPGRLALLAIVVVCSTVSLFASTLVTHGSNKDGISNGLQLGMTLLAAGLAWVLMHSTYTLHYAHLYYGRPGGKSGGLAFPGEESPCGLDFAYFSFTVGMCFQVSDVAVESSRMRTAVLGHAMLSFVFNTLVLALTVNLLLVALV